MRALSFLLVSFAAVAAMADDPAPQSPTPQPATKTVKVEFFWGEGERVGGLTEDEGIVWRETGERLYLHKQPILTSKDVVKIDVDKTVFGGTAIPNEQFTVRFHLTREARKRLAETCGPSGEKMLAAMIDGKRYGTPFYLKLRDEANFVPFAGMFSSKATVDRIVAAFAPANPRIKVELRWAEFKPVPGLTEDKGVPFGEEGSSLIYLHKQAVLTIEDIAEARIEGEITVGAGDLASKVYGVNLYLTKEGKQKLAQAGERGKKKLLATLLDGRNPSTFYVDVADLSNFVQPVGYYTKPQAEQLVKGIKPPAVPAAKAED